VSGAVAYLSGGPVTHPDVGEPAGAYPDQGFDIAERCGGRQTGLRPTHGRAPQVIPADSRRLT
jgi:hypothetical protein